MGRRGSINEAQVFEAADALVAQGREVTPTALLSALGSGSFTTIYKHLTAWEESRVSASTERTAAIPDAVLSAFGAAWRTASAEAGREVITVREQAAEEVRAAKAQFQEALQTIERLESESEADAGRFEALTAKVAELVSALQKAETEKAAITATAEQLHHQVKSQEAELERVHKDAEAERKQHQEELSKAAASAAAAQDKANAEIERLRGQLSDTQKRAGQAESERTEAQVKLEQVGKQIAETSQRLQTAEQKQEAASREREAAIKEAAELKGQAQTLKAQNNELMTKLSQLAAPKKAKE